MKEGSTNGSVIYVSDAKFQCHIWKMEILSSIWGYKQIFSGIYGIHPRKKVNVLSYTVLLYFCDGVFY